MVSKLIHWIKENGWIIVGIFLTVNIIYIYFTDKYYYYNAENVRYTIAKYKQTGFIRSRTVYSFLYEVYGKTYNANTEQILSNYNLEEDRLLIKYSAKQYGAGEVVKVVVPKWVLTHPKTDGNSFLPM